MIDVIVPINCLIPFHCALVPCGTPPWFIHKGEHHANTREFSTIVEK